MKITKNQLLVIIDPQNDFTSPEGAYAKRHAGITQILATRHNINQRLKTVPEQQVVIIYSDYRKNQFGAGISMCIPGTKGHEIDLEFNSLHQLICKTEHSCFSSSLFSEYLLRHKVNSLILCGFLAEYCVRQTALDGLAKGYEIIVLGDVIATGDDVQERKYATLTELEEKGAKIIGGK